ncbi:poly [ADP-ribose] polymerase 12-like [Alligator mississippiensis]|uniref:Poly [ADP-ribose] polymerase n=1 Tax=Alligator mississippiensis TaxID=8496 RepID=A0A151NI74_ALLMI|nr:poly [ADP-ribose] polymerase 12-like [Alligator mississippiensis]
MEYAWYWQDEHGEWIEYGQPKLNHSAATITSEELEEAFLNNQKKMVLFKAGSQYYELNFQDMFQRNLHYQTQRKVCRWPKFVSSGHSNKGWRRRSRTAAPGCPFPPDWDLSALPDVGYKLVDVSSIASEYMRIKDLFEKTMQCYYIHKLQRIQNPSLWQVFQWQKEQMKKINRQEDVDERLLFHGTNTSHLHAICEQNFDWRICGAHGTAYGKGSYFAKDARYSHGYCDPNSSHKTMFVAQSGILSKALPQGAAGQDTTSTSPSLEEGGGAAPSNLQAKDTRHSWLLSLMGWPALSYQPLHPWTCGPTSGHGGEPTSPSEDVASVLPSATGALYVCCLCQQWIQNWMLLLQWLVTVAEEQEAQEQAWE